MAVKKCTAKCRWTGDNKKCPWESPDDCDSGVTPVKTVGTRLKNSKRKTEKKITKKKAQNP